MIQGILSGQESSEFVNIIERDIAPCDEDDCNESTSLEEAALRELEEMNSRSRKKFLEKKLPTNIEDSISDEVSQDSSVPENAESDVKRSDDKEVSDSEVDREDNKPSNDNVSQVEDENKPEIEGEKEKTLESTRVNIGTDRSGNNVYWEFGNSQLANRHLLITGTSGQGKTYSIQTMLYEISKSNVSTVIFDYTEGFRPDQLEKKFLEKMDGRIVNKVVYFEGVSINPFKRNEIEVAGMKAPEKIADVAQRIANILTHVYSF